MNKSRLLSLPSFVSTVVFAVIASGSWGIGVISPAWGYTPDSPVVVEAVDRGIAYLEKHMNEPSGPGVSATAEGGHMLSAYTHHKVVQDPTHAVVQRGLATAQSLARQAMQNGLPVRAEITYECSVAILLMIEVDPSKYATLIQGLGNVLMSKQKPHGGFGYLNEEDGDTSQTQYCMLAMWTMDQADFNVPRANVDRAVQWLLRTQDPTGRWGYKGKDSGRVGVRIAQDDRQSHSLTTAGGGSVLIGGDYFGLWRSAKQLKPDIPNLPPALREASSVDEMQQRRESFKIPPENLLQFIGLSENYMNQNPYRRPGGPSWHYYYMYTLERYKSFLEVARGVSEKEPDWYNQGVDSLLAFQAPDGSWGAVTQDQSHSDGEISTCFSILFLIRSTKKALGDMGEGLMAGGYELPKDTTKIVVDGTQIKPEKVATSVTDMLSLLEGEDANKLESGSIPEDLKLAKDPAERKKQLARLERLARSSQSWQARRVATRLLAQSDSLESVPTLIFALTDGDTIVRRYARDGLRFISRKFNGFGLPDDPEQQEIDKAVDQWKAWYTKLNPSYVFLD